MQGLVMEGRALDLLEDPGPPPTDGPLPAVASGWLLRRVEGALPFRGLPRGLRWFSWVASFVPPVMGVLGAVTFSVLAPSALALLLGLTPLVLSPFVAVRAARWRLARVMEEGGRHASLAQTPRGSLVKVTGRVRAGASFVTAGHRRPAVLALYVGFRELGSGRFSDGPPVPFLETRGIDFTLELDGGETVRIDAREVFLADLAAILEDYVDAYSNGPRHEPLAQATRSTLGGSLTELLVHETAIGPGDRIEVLGLLDHEVNRDADTAPGRGARLVPVLRAGRKTPLVVRVAEAPQADRRQEEVCGTPALAAAGRFAQGR